MEDDSIKDPRLLPKGAIVWVEFVGQSGKAIELLDAILRITQRGVARVSIEPAERNPFVYQLERRPVPLSQRVPQVELGDENVVRVGDWANSFVHGAVSISVQGAGDEWCLVVRNKGYADRVLGESRFVFLDEKGRVVGIALQEREVTIPKESGDVRVACARPRDRASARAALVELFWAREGDWTKRDLELFYVVLSR